MVGELVKGGQPRPNLEGSAPASSPSSVPTRTAKRMKLKGKKEDAKAAAVANTKGGNITNCWMQVAKEPMSGSSRRRGIPLL